MPQGINKPRNIWERLQRDVKMADAIGTFQSIKEELDAANRADIEAQRALWREKSLAKRQGRQPDPRYARAWVATGDRIHQLKIEHGLHSERKVRNEYFYDPDLAFTSGGPRSDGKKAVKFSITQSDFQRQP